VPRSASFVHPFCYHPITSFVMKATRVYLVVVLVSNNRTTFDKNRFKEEFLENPALRYSGLAQGPTP
jgi:hypothetical protein